VWGLVRADGAPIDPGDAAKLGLPQANHDRLAMGRDAQDPDLVDELRDSGGQTILTGWIADRSHLAVRLGIPTGCGSAALARAALMRFGKDAPAEMLGEWSLYHSEPGSAVWLMQAATVRDRLFFVASGKRLAFASDALALRQLAWIDARLDPEAIAMSLGRYEIRLQLGARSILRGIEKILPGCSIRFASDGSVQRGSAELLVPQPRFSGTADDALVALEETLRSVLRERLGQTSRAAILLSGGLDSSLLAALAAQELARMPLALCSIAPPGSGIEDEYAFAQAVADRHGMAIEPVCPGPEADPFRPAPHVLAGAEFPLLSNRHCLTSRFQDVARDLGATMLVNGTYGEMSVTARLPGPLTLRQRLGAVRRFVASRLQSEHHDFHVALAPHRLAAWAQRRPEAARMSESIWLGPDQTGYIPGSEKALVQPNAFYAGALRMDFPYRDLRLLRLYASLPLELVYALGRDRGPARSIAKELLPDAIQLRQSGMAADPGHYARLQAFAALARSRIATFRAAGIDDWLDLGWLDQALARVAQRGVTGVDDANRVQLTALAAEYLTWARSGAEGCH
jgi:asparagine synthase (glutamine-hydrolysing)